VLFCKKRSESRITIDNSRGVPGIFVWRGSKNMLCTMILQHETTEIDGYHYPQNFFNGILKISQVTYTVRTPGLPWPAIRPWTTEATSDKYFRQWSVVHSRALSQPISDGNNSCSWIFNSGWLSPVFRSSVGQRGRLVH